MAEIDVCSHGRPDHQALVREFREACGLPGPPLPISPQQAWKEAIAVVRSLRRLWVAECEEFGCHDPEADHSSRSVATLGDDLGDGHVREAGGRGDGAP